MWSPDSRRIAFSSNRDGTWRIYLMDARRHGRHAPARPATGDATDPAWSPDGGRIAFVSTRSGNSDIWVVNLDGSGLQPAHHRLEARRGADMVAAGDEPDRWSNGRRRQLDIWKMRPDGTGQDAADDDEGPGHRGRVGLRRHDRLRPPREGRPPLRDLDDDRDGTVRRRGSSSPTSGTTRSRRGSRTASSCSPRIATADDDFDLFRGHERVGDELAARPRHERARRRPRPERLSPPRRTTIAAWRSQPPTGSTTRRTTTRTS